VARRRRKRFFFEKKNQKTFDFMGLAGSNAHPKAQKFSLLFSKRRAFFLCSGHNTPA
jgi:hypothetical protein